MNWIRSILRNRRVSPGWGIPMVWFAWFGVMMHVMFGLNDWLQNIVLAWGGWLTLWITGLVGTAAIGYDSVRNVRRFGPTAMGRPRFFFELSRGTVALVFLLWAPALTFAWLLPNMNVPKVRFFKLQQLIAALSVMFSLTAACGYLTSFLTGRRCHGRAYECTSWFFCVGGGTVLVAFGYIVLSEPKRLQLPTLVGTLTCFIGVVLLFCGILAEARREKRTGASNPTESAL